MSSQPRTTIIDIRHLTKPQPSGVGHYTLELLKALFKIDQTNEYLLFSSGSTRALENLPVFDKPNVRRFHLKIPNRILNASLIATGWPKFDELVKPHLAKDKKPFFFFTNLNIVSLSPGTDYVLTLHDLSFEIFPEFYDRKSRLWHKLTGAKKLAADARAIIVPSSSAKNDVANIFTIAPEKIFVVPHGIGSEFSPRSTPQDHGVNSKYHLPKKFALFFGTLEPRKNLRAVIEAVEKYREQTHNDLHLILAGKPTFYVKKLFHSLSKNQKQFVRQLGYVKTQDRPALYRLAEVVLFPSIYEGFGLPIIEAQASGTPVITSNTSSMPEVSGRAAICVDPYNPNDLAAALKELFLNQEFKKQKISEGLERTKEFSWKKTAEQTQEILNKISIS
jgi:glycosyltransferase involved in cell wall biosynthesis